LIFIDAHGVIMNKMDLLPHVDFDMGAFRSSVTALNPEVEFFQISCKTGEGIEKWCSWVLEQAEANTMNR
jgi:hydrogenase nickel incorporation protein HypB